MDKVDSALAADLGVGLEYVKGNLINFVFAALILGLTCTRTTSHHTTLRGVITSLLHEGRKLQLLIVIVVRLYILAKERKKRLQYLTSALDAAFLLPDALQHVGFIIYHFNI